MARTILIDADVIEQIGRGNQGAAEALKTMRTNGDTIYVSQQAYNEMVVNPAIPRTATAKREFLREMNIQIAPPGDMEQRINVVEANRTSSGNTILGPGDVQVAANARAINGEVWSFDRPFRTNANSVRQTLGVDVAAECSLPLANAPEDYRVARRLAGLPEIEIDLSGNVRRPEGGGGGPGMPDGSGTPGMSDHETTHTRMLGAVMAVGVIVSWLDQYCIDRDSQKDVKEWEEYISRRQLLDPENGFLLVAIIKVWRPLDAAYDTRSYMGMEMIEDYTLLGAEARVSRTILPGLPPPSDTVSYTYVKTWIAPLQPRPVLSPDQKDEKLYGRQPWYPRYQLVRHSLEPPPSYGEALGALQGSSMFDILRVLDALPASQFNALKSQVNIVVPEATNRSRFKIAFAAVEEHRSESSFGFASFQTSFKDEYAALGNDFERNCIKDWVEGGSGSIGHTLQGKWEVVWQGGYFEYSFYLSGKVIWRDKNNPGPVGGEGTWRITPLGVRVEWPRTGTVETFEVPLNTENQKAKCEMKTGTYSMTAKKINPYP